MSGKGGGSACGELHLLLAVLPVEGFTLTIHTQVLIIKRGAEEQDDSVVRALGIQFPVTVLLSTYLVIFSPSVPQFPV